MAESLIGIDASRSYVEPMTGTERYSRRIIEHLIDLAPEDLQLRLYFRDTPPTDAQLDGAERRVLPARRFWTHHRLRRELKAHPVDLLFVPSHVLPVGYNGRSVVTIHDLGYLHEPGSHTTSSRVQLDLTTRWNTRRASRIIAISYSTRDDLIEHYSVDPAQISVIHHGIDPQFEPIHGEKLERYRQDQDLPDRFILYLGTIQPRKNLVRLISAFEQIAIEDRDIELVIAGATGWKATPIITRARSSSVSSRIRFTGHVPDYHLPSLYGAATVLALPSLYEGFGFPALEAMACGTPVVMSNRGALPEIKGADTQLVDPLNVEEIAERIGDSLHSSSNPEKQRLRVDHASGFSWESSARKTLDVLRNVVST
jgi:glycosyltransferase involved in cell wall biosynthesis